MKKQKPTADVILRELVRGLVKEYQDPENIIPIEEVKTGDTIAWLYKSHNVNMVYPLGVSLMKVKEISKSPVIDSNLYHVVTEMFAGFQIDPVTGSLNPGGILFDNLTIINPDIGEIVRATEDQIRTAYDATNMFKKGS